jgi:hypothetical protein
MQNNDGGVTGKNWFYIVLLAVVTVVFFNRLLFTDQIIRASDVITQYFWGARTIKDMSLLRYLTETIPTSFQASWSPLVDGGRSLEGGWNANNLLFYERLILHLLPFPASISWLTVLSLLWGGIGTFMYCRFIGIGRAGAFAAGLLFTLCAENASLINAGHIQKIETISWFPWVLLFLEKALRSGRLFHYAMTALMLSVQFFNMHWQISFYSCLAVAAYWLFHVGSGFVQHKGEYVRPFRKDVLSGFVIVLLFFMTIAMSFAPLFSWSKQSERSGGMSYEEGMSWSMPPEELVTFFIPGAVGYSRQEAGDVPGPGQVSYWGRMQMSQTNDYLGLLPWFLLPLALIFRRDRLTWFFSFLLAATLLMALGKYTVVYRVMFEYLPGFSTFRVPKMVLFLTAFAAAVLMGRGVDCLEAFRDERKGLGRWMAASTAVVAMIGLVWLILSMGKGAFISQLSGLIDQPTRYQSHQGLVTERYANMTREAGIAFGMAGLYLSLLYAWYRRLLAVKILIPALLILFVADLWRVSDHFQVLTHPPEANRKKSKNDVVTYLESRIGTYRMQPLGEESAFYYSDFGLANISAYVTISENRYKDFLDNFSLMSRMPDMLNLKYLVMPMADFRAQQAVLESKYSQVFATTNGSVVLENRMVLPKAWLVHQVFVSIDPVQRLSIMSRSLEFDPARIAIVEKTPPFPLDTDNSTSVAGTVKVERYEPNRIAVKVATDVNSLLVLGEKFNRWWYADIDGTSAEIVPVNHILRGVYLRPGTHTVEFRFDPLPFKIGKYLTLSSFVFFAVLLIREWLVRRKQRAVGG